MRYYQELTLLPGAEVSLNFLLPKVFMQIHYAFGQYMNQKGYNDIGISFPNYASTGLGDKIRLIAPDEASLTQLDVMRYMEKLNDYIYFLKTRMIPQRKICGYSIYSRYRPPAGYMQPQKQGPAVFSHYAPNKPLERMARRFAKRHPDVSYEEALKLIKLPKSDLQLPYITKVNSKSTGQYYQIYVQKKSVDTLIEGGFSSYGFSSTASVPEF